MNETQQALADTKAREILQPYVMAAHTLQALRAGMPTASARRWPRYLAMKARRQQQPITLEQAVQQCRDARTSR